MAIKRMNGQKTTLWFIKASVYPSGPPATLSLATLSAAITGTNMINITDAVQQGYTLSATDSDTQDAKSVGDYGNAQARGAGNFEASIDIFRENDPVTNTTSDYLLAYNLFKAGRVDGYLMKRFGYAKTVALAVAQKVSIFQVTSDYPTDIPGEGGGPVGMHIPFAQQGWMLLNEPIVA